MADLGQFKIGKAYPICLAPSLHAKLDNDSESEDETEDDSLVCLKYNFKPPIKEKEDGVAIIETGKGKDVKWVVELKGADRDNRNQDNKDKNIVTKTVHFQGSENKATPFAPESLLVWHADAGEGGEGGEGKFVVEPVDKIINLTHNAQFVDDDGVSVRKSTSMIAGCAKRKRPATNVEKIVARKIAKRK